MSGAVRGLDHVLVGTADLAAARAAYERLGFTTSPRGRHIGWGTANVCLMFPHDYVELLGIVDASQFTNNLDRFLEDGEGLLGVAFAGGDLAAAKARLAEAGIASDGPRDLSRTLELPEGEARPAFRLLHLPPEATPGLSAFLCRHLTPEIVWREEWTRHANGATGIAGLTAVVEEPGAVALAYGELLGLDAVHGGDRLVEVDCGACALRFTDLDGLARLHPRAAERAPRPLPWLAGLQVRVADPLAAAEVLECAGVDVRRAPDGPLRIAPAEACGVALELVGA